MLPAVINIVARLLRAPAETRLDARGADNLAVLVRVLDARAREDGLHGVTFPGGVSAGGFCFSAAGFARAGGTGGFFGLVDDEGGELRHGAVFVGGVAEGGIGFVCGVVRVGGVGGIGLGLGELKSDDLHAGAGFGDVGFVDDVAQDHVVALISEEVRKPEDLAFLVFVLLDALEVAALRARGVGDVGLLLLVDLSRVHDLLDCAGGNEAEDLDVAGLADAVGAILGLQVVGRVPVRIDDDDFVGGGDVEPYAAGFGADQEDEGGGVAVEVVDCFGTVEEGHAAVEVGDGVGGVVEEELEHLQEAHGVRENENLVAIGVPEAEELLEDLPFAAELRIGEVEDGVAVAIEVAPLVRDGDLEHFEFFVLFLFGIDALWYEHCEVVRELLEVGYCGKDVGLPLHPIGEKCIAAPALFLRRAAVTGKT